MTGLTNELERLRDAWQPQWEQALDIWSRFTKLKDPTWCLTSSEEKREALSGSFAMIRLNDQAVVVSLSQVREMGLEAFAVEILAHEIGHHIYCPANLTDHGRMIARMRPALPTKEMLAPFVANLYADLLINDRLQRGAGLNMAAVYNALNAQQARDSPRSQPSQTWALYMRIYEILWSIQKGLLGGGGSSRLEGDAQLGARLIRSYAREWLDGSGRFAALLLPYLLEDSGIPVEKLLRGWLDTKGAGAGASGVPAGLTEIDAGEESGAIHPSLDPDLSGIDAPDGPSGPPTEETGVSSSGQFREPFEFGEILRSLGMDVSDHYAAVAYYRERAVPHLVRFPVREMEQSTEPLAEGLEPWDIGLPIEDIDWLQTVLASPTPVPGMTTMQRTWGVMAGGQPEIEPIDLDLCVDCSGSMPNPQLTVSYLTLAGTIIALSAIRVGARVQATLWSGARQYETTGGFISDANRVLRILTGYLGGATAFPIHLLRETYQNRKPSDRAVHVLVLSDDGVDTMFATDEKGGSGRDIAQMAIEKARGGATLALNLYKEPSAYPDLLYAAEIGYRIYRVRDWEELVAFARAFSKAAYSQPAAAH